MIPPSVQLPDALRDSAAWTLCDDAAFRALTRRYEAVSRDRVQIGQQLTAIFEGRDSAWGDTCRADAPVDRLLADIRHGRRNAPAPMAGTYHELCETERGIREQVAAQLTRHPVGPWVGRLHGVGTMLAAQLVTRLDRACAPRPSSFWAFCGLTTMPAVHATCAGCGARLELPVGARPPDDHADARDNAVRCRGDVRPLALAGSGEGERLRVAMSRGGPSVERKFDQAARVTCHLIGVTMVRSNGTYAPVYHEARERFRRERDGWSGGRIHLSALRVMEKRFLLDLWHAWPPPRTVGEGCVGRERDDSAPGHPSAIV